MKKFPAFAFVASALMVGTQPATATTYALGFSSLPSAQGWSYLTEGGGAGIPDSTLYTATGSSLFQNTLGIPTETRGGNFYTRGFTMDAGADFSLDVNARVSTFEGQTLGGSTIYPFSYFFTVGTTTGYSIFGVAGSRFGYLDQTGAVAYGDFAPGFSLGRFNDYRISRTNGLTSLSVNGVTLASYIAPLLGGNALELGEGTGFANASGEMRSFVFNTSSVPEPTTWGMMIIGFGIVGWSMRQRGRRFTESGRQPAI